MKVVQIASTAGQGKTETMINAMVGYACVYWNGESTLQYVRDRLPKSIPHAMLKIVIVNPETTVEAIDEIVGILHESHTPEKCLLFIDDPARMTRPTRDYQTVDYLKAKFDRVWESVQLRRERGHVI